jgi:chemotaxis signal transduction protein
VFDSEPQFAAMLRDALPHDGAGSIKPGAFGLFVEPGGRVIACSDQHFNPGDVLAIDETFLRLGPGAAYSGVTILGDTYFAVGVNASAGYREYKDAQDAYKSNVIALIFTPLCAVEDHALQEPVPSLSIRSDRMQTGAKQDIATLRVGARWFAARVSEVVEAINGAGIVPLPFMPEGMVGCLMYQGSALPVLDLRSFLELPAENVGSEPGRHQIVVMTLPNQARFGLLVDDLGEIVEVLTARLAPLPAMVADQDMFADCAISPDDGDDRDVVVVLRADRLHANLSPPAAQAAAPAAAPGRAPAEPSRLAVAKRA